MELNLQVLTLFSIPVSLAFLIYFITKYFTIKEYSEKKKEKMLEWVHDTLFDKVYEPLKHYTSKISGILNPREDWEKAEKDYRRDVLLFSVSKFMYYSYTMVEQDIAGKSEFFTMYNRSNDYLHRLLEKIIRELKQVCAGTESALVSGSLEESIVIKLQFLATCGKARNYAEFKPLIEGDSRLNPALALELNLLKETYSGKGYLPKDNREIYSMFVTLLGEIFNENDPAQKWRKAKLYAYCTLFHKLLAYELHRMYDTWYVGYQDNLDLNELFYTIDRVFELTESADKYEKLCAEYRELCDREWDIENELDMIMATTKGVIRNNPNAQDELERFRNQQSELENELDEIRKRKGEIQDEIDEDISPLYDISWDKNNLFDESSRKHKTSSYRQS